MTFKKATILGITKPVALIYLFLINTNLYGKELPAVDCVITPYEIIDLASPVPGVLDDILVERSEQVSKGQVVAKLAAGIEQATVALAKLRADIQSEIKARKVNLAFDQRSKNRIDALYQKQAVSFNQADEAARALQLSALELQQAKELSQIRSLELHQAEEKCNVDRRKARREGGQNHAAFQGPRPAGRDCHATGMRADVNEGARPLPDSFSLCKGPAFGGHPGSLFGELCAVDYRGACIRG